MREALSEFLAIPKNRTKTNLQIAAEMCISEATIKRHLGWLRENGYIQIKTLRNRNIGTAGTEAWTVRRFITFLRPFTL